MAWYIVDGDLPFEYEFPQTYTIDDAPAIFWRIVDGNLPFRSAGYPQMYNSIDEAPVSFWRIIDGKLPFRITFPKMYKVTAGSKLYFGNKRVKKIFFGDKKIKSLYNGDTKIF